jgi:subtilisin family serine protease
MLSDSKLSTFYFSRDKRRCGLRVLKVNDQSVHGVPHGRLLSVTGREDASRLSTLVTNTARGLFEMTSFSIDMLEGVKQGRQKTVNLLPTVFEDEQDRRVRVTYKELVVRFRQGVDDKTRRQLLAKFGFVENAKSLSIADQLIATQPAVRYEGEALVAIANEITNTDEVLFSVPNFVSEFQRARIPNPIVDQWHLNGGAFNAGLAEAWKVTTGDSAVTIAVLDDGVDVAHPDLSMRLLRDPDKSNKKDKHGRDFFVPSGQPDHYDPSPKRWQYPYHLMDGNDIHGTCCAGVALADGNGGKRVFGVAPGCRLLPVKVFHGNELCTDTRVAEAIRYAGKFARVLSLSWTGPQTPDIEFALGDDIGKEHGGRGAVVCVASGNGSANAVGYPAADPSCIAVGAMTNTGVRAIYSNYGPELSVVAPSGGGTRRFTPRTYPRRIVASNPPASTPTTSREHRRLHRSRLACARWCCR